MISAQVYQANDGCSQEATIRICGKIDCHQINLPNVMGQDASAIYNALRASLPQGTLDRLTILCLNRELSIRVNLETERAAEQSA